MRHPARPYPDFAIILPGVFHLQRHIIEQGNSDLEWEASLDGVPDTLSFIPFEEHLIAIMRDLISVNDGVASSPPPEQPFDIRPLQLDIGRAAVIALAAVGGCLHLAQ